MGGGNTDSEVAAPGKPDNSAAISASQQLPSAKSVMLAAQHPATRHIVTFIVVLIVLVVLNPPFVQEDVERKHVMEAVPCSLPRAVFGAFLVTLIVAATPLLLQHRESFISAWARVTSWISKE